MGAAHTSDNFHDEKTEDPLSENDCHLSVYCAAVERTYRQHLERKTLFSRRIQKRRPCFFARQQFSLQPAVNLQAVPVNIIF